MRPKLFKHRINQRLSNQFAGAQPLKWFGPGRLQSMGYNAGTGKLTVQGGEVFVEAWNGASGWTGGIDVKAGAKLVANTPQSGGSYYGCTITVDGVSVSDPNGLNLRGINNFLILLQTAPQTIRAWEGFARLKAFDVNGYHLNCLASASGSVIDAATKIISGGYGYHINVRSGANNASGDLEVKGEIQADMVVGFGIVLSGDGHAKFTGDAPGYGSQDAFWEMNGQFSGGSPGNALTGKCTIGGAFRWNKGRSAVRIRQGAGGFEWASSMAQELTAVWSGSGPVTISGAGPLKLSASNTRSGATTIANLAKLIIAGTNGSAAHTVSSGGTLRAEGTAGTIAALTMSAAGSKFEVLGVSDGTLTKLTCSAITAASGFTVDFRGKQALEGVYTILACTASLPGTLPTVGANETNLTVVLAWVNGTGLQATLSRTAAAMTFEDGTSMEFDDLITAMEF